MMLRATSSLVLLGGFASAAPVVDSVSPPLCDAAAASRWTLAGSDLATVESVALRRPGAADLPLQVLSQNAIAIEAGAPTAGAAAALYHLVYTHSGGTEAVLPNAVEIRRARAVAIDGFTTANTEYPLHRGVLLVNTEVILLPADLGRAGTIESIALHPAASEALDGAIVVRAKEEAGTEFATNNLDSSGWTEMLSGAIDPAVGGSPLILTASAPLAYSGAQPLRLSFLFTAAATGPTLPLHGWDAGANRLRAGRALSSGTPIGSWSGTTPALRTLSPTLPRLTIYFSDTTPTAAFTIGATTAEVGEPVTFTNTSSAFASAWRWDFDRDGTVDSTDQHPVHVYTAPGVYDVALVAVNGSSEDSATVLSAVTVTPAPSGVGDWRALEPLQ